MSGGHLVVLDRAGRDVKRYPLAEGMATLGSDPSCDIRIMLPSVSSHHATIAVHANQTVVRAVGGGATLVNGARVSVAALRHRDVLALGGRRLRWDYAEPGARRQAPQPALHVWRAPRARPARRSAPAQRARDAAVQRALEMTHRASMPGSAGGKQVAIVQPQRRDTAELNDSTKASQWIESRKPARKRAGKVPPPAAVDHTKQAALLLMTGGKARLTTSANTTQARSPGLDTSAVGVSPPGGSARKSALRDPRAKRSSRKTESIKFDLSNLEPSPAAARMETYSIVDLVSADSDASVYGSAAGTSLADLSDAPALGCSTPYAAGRPTRSLSDRSRRSTRSLSDRSRRSTRSLSDRSRRSTRSLSDRSRRSTRSSKASANDDSRISSRTSTSSRRSRSAPTPEKSRRSLATPESAKRNVSERSGRSTRGRSRVDDSDVLVVEADGTGASTPENRRSPEEAGTPVLSIQSLLDSSQGSFASLGPPARGRLSTRKTIGVLTGPRTRVSVKSRSMNASMRETRARRRAGAGDSQLTPKSAVKLVQEAVKNKHSTAKKPQSKRSIIDDLNESDIVKQLFNSPVKRKLSQSMTEFSRQRMFEDEPPRPKSKRNTIAVVAAAPDESLPDLTGSYSPELFVSPIGTPAPSPDLAGIKRLFAERPGDDLRDVSGVKKLLRTPRARRSVRNDLTDVTGVKAAFARSPRNRLSDVNVKNVFASSPKNDLRRVTGVGALFRAADARRSPRNDLRDVRGVKRLFARSPRDDLRDVRGVRRAFRPRREPAGAELSGVGRLFAEPDADAELAPEPRPKAVLSKSFGGRAASLAPSRSRARATLPLKKRSLERSRSRLPLKKRAVRSAPYDASHTGSHTLAHIASHSVSHSATYSASHSTPLRNTRQAPEPRESPIARDAPSASATPTKYNRSSASRKNDRSKTAERTRLNMCTSAPPSPARAPTAATPTKGESKKTPRSSKRNSASPKKVISSKAKPTRISKARGKPVSPVKLPSPVKVKSPSPKKASPEVRISRITRNKRDTSTKANSPKNVTSKAKVNRSTTKKAVILVKVMTPSPKKTVTKATRSTRAKESAQKVTPKAKPTRAKKNEAASRSNIASPTTKSTRSNKSKKTSPLKAKKQSPKKVTPTRETKSRRAAKATVASPVTAPAKKTRTRRTATTPENTRKKAVNSNDAKKQPIERASRKRKEPETSVTSESPKKSRGARKAAAAKPNTPKNTRAKVLRVNLVVLKPSPQPKPRAAKRSRTEPSGEASNKSRTQKKVETPAPNARGKRSAVESVKTGGSQQKVGRKTANNAEQQAKSPAKTRSKKSAAEPRAGPSAASDLAPAPARPARGEKTNVEVVPDAGQRRLKRKLVAEPLPTEGKKPRGGKKMTESVIKKTQELEASKKPAAKRRRR